MAKRIPLITPGQTGGQGTSGAGLTRAGAAPITRGSGPNPKQTQAAPNVSGAEKKAKVKAAPLLEQLRAAEGKLASIKDSDPNAQWAISRLRAQQQAVDGNDSLYWFALCFQSRVQKDIFLKAVGLYRDDAEQYFSGVEFAKILGIDLADDTRAFTPMTVNKRWAKFALPIGGEKGKR